MGFYLWSCRERVFLCILQFLKKGRWHYVPKCFPTYQPNYLWVFIFKSREKGVFFQKTGFWRTLLSIFMNCFSLHLWKKGIYETIHQKIFQLIIQIIYGFAENSSFSASCNFWKRVVDTMFQKIFQLITQYIYGFLFSKVERKGFSFKKRGFEEHYYQFLWIVFLCIFEKGYLWDHTSKCFPTY